MKNQANLSILHLLGCGEVGLHGVLDTQGEEQGDEAPGQIANKAAKNAVPPTRSGLPDLGLLPDLLMNLGLV